MDERNLTVIIVDAGELETRTFVIPYRKLRIVLILAVAFVLTFAFVLMMWFPVALTAAKVPALKRELATLEAERAKVQDLAKALSDVEAQYRKVRELLGADAPAAGSPPLLPPLKSDSTKPTSNSDEPPPLAQMPEIRIWPLAVRGFLTQTVGTGRNSHPGIDIAVAQNSNVRAAGKGVVATTGTDDVYGKFIVIDHGAGYQSVYGHINKILVRKGDTVAAGQSIALSGSTGRSSGSHLHFEVRRDREFLDPLRFVRQPD